MSADSDLNLGESVKRFASENKLHSMFLVGISPDGILSSCFGESSKSSVELVGAVELTRVNFLNSIGMKQKGEQNEI